MLNHETPQAALRKQVAIQVRQVLQSSEAAPFSPCFRVLAMPAADTHSDAAPPPAASSISEIYHRARQRLLITGADGSGKTTALLQLASALLEQGYCPVWLDLASWGKEGQAGAEGRYQRLAPWILDELYRNYGIHPELGEPLLQQESLILLLDGLDETGPAARPACIDAIAAFSAAYSAGGMVLCCRTEEYTALQTTLEWPVAVCLQPLENEQINAYLEACGEPLQGLRDLLKQDKELFELARTPLWLDMMSQAYHGADAEEITRDRGDNSEQRRTALLERYVRQTFAHHGEDPEFSPVKTMKWLGWLAGRMQERGRNVFHVEYLQPDWHQRAWVYGFCFRLLGGLFWGVLGGLIVLQIGKFGGFGGPDKFIVGLMFGFISSLLAGFYGGGLMLSMFLLEAVKQQQYSCGRDAGVFLLFLILPIVLFNLQPGKNPAPSTGLPRIGVLLTGVFAGILTVPMGIGFLASYGLLGLPLLLVLVTVFVGLLSGGYDTEIDVAAQTRRWSWTALRNDWWMEVFTGGLLVGVFVGLAAGQPHGLFLGIASGLLVGLLEAGLSSRALPGDLYPNRGIRLALRNSLRMMWLWAPLTVLLFTVLWRFNPATVVTAGAGGAMAGFVLFGGITVMRHYALRAALFTGGCAPFRYVSFLEDCSRLKLLQRCGGGYRFIHRTVLDHFAARYNPVKFEP